MLLALDTATQFASIALFDGQQVQAELSWSTQRRHTSELAPQLDALLRLQNLKPVDINAVAVAIGPGSYTGTRVALSLAKGIVAAGDLPLIGIPTLDALAYPHLGVGLPVAALVAAGRGRFCWASYATGQGAPQRTSAWGLARLPEILSILQPPFYFVGELSPADCSQLRQAWGDAAVLASPALAVRRAGCLAELAWQRWQAGDVDDPILLAPIYLG